jgi:hypothetical protein
MDLIRISAANTLAKNKGLPRKRQPLFAPTSKNLLMFANQMVGL